MTALLAGDVGVWSDGVGKASAARPPLVGRDTVLNFLIRLRLAAQTAGLVDVRLAIEDVNSEPRWWCVSGSSSESIFVFSIGRRSFGIRVVRNPDKLAHIDRQLTTSH